MEEKLSTPAEQEASSSSIVRFCSSCQSNVSIIWHRQSRHTNDLWLCNFCHTKKRLSVADSVRMPFVSSSEMLNTSDDSFATDTTEESGGKNSTSPSSNKSKSSSTTSRSKTSKSRQSASRMSSRPNSSSISVNAKSVQNRNKTRKHVRKSTHPERAVFHTHAVSTTGTLWHNGQLFTEGDIVGVVDETDERTYYATIRGLLKDQFCNKYAALTWLLPKPSVDFSAPFDNSNFTSGPQDEKLYDLDCLQFICHSFSTLSLSAKVASNNDDKSLFFQEDFAKELSPEKQFAGV